MNKVEELLHAMQKKEDQSHKNTLLWILAIIGTVAAVAGIAYGVYRFFAPDYLEDFEEDFDDDFDDYFDEEDEEEE
jgi:flagellar basal body-associated protein FliL